MILLNTPYATSGPNITTVSDTYVKMVGCTVNWMPGILTLTMNFLYGKVPSSVFVSDGNAPNAMTLVCSLVTNTWSAYNGTGFTTSGSLTGPQITAVQNAITAAQTATQATGEQFAAASLLPGSYSVG